MSFFDAFGMMFDPDDGPRRRSGDSDDEPVILNVEADGGDGDAPRRNAPRGRNAGPRIAGKSSKPRKGADKAAKILIGVVLVLVVIVALFFGLDRFITDLLWYDQLGFQSVVWTQLGVRVGLWVVYAAVTALVGYIAATLAIRARPADTDGSTIRINGDVVEVAKGISSRKARMVAVAVALVVGVLFGTQFNANWSEILLMFNAQSFGTTDAQFGIDNGFYVFVLPGLKLVMSAVSTTLLVGIVFSVVTHVLMGGIRFTMPVNGRGLFSMTKRTRRQLAIWLMLNMFALAARLSLDVFDNLTTEGDRITGADYTAVNATIPITFLIAAMVAVLGVVLGVWLMRSKSLERPAALGVRASVALRQWRVPLIAVAVVVVLAVVLAGVWPAVLQRFIVEPNAQERESTYIERNIAATRQAYGLEDMVVEEYDATTEGEAGALSSDAESTAQIRLLDPEIVSPTFKQLQQSRQYYTFADTLSVDKYEIDGVSQDTVIAARELDLDGLDNRNWVNDHTVYTHGYGVVAAYGNKVTSDGQPEFFEYGIPTQGVLTETEEYEPRIYFSPNADEYAIVGAPEGTESWEFDYPTGSDEGATNTFDGDGGPSLGNIFSRLLYAIRFGSIQILFSDRVNSESQILYDRSPQERVAKVAPYLTLDERIYPAVVDGRVKWIIDGYTTSDDYPYSQMTDFGEAIADSTTDSTQTESQQVNYIRNSVKVTVDAYDGSVDLYVWDEDDPIIQAWQQIFPDQYHSLSEISGDLMSHMRYPESLFKVQRELLEKYHVTSASQFFSGEDFWQVPNDPTSSDSDSGASTTSDEEDAYSELYSTTDSGSGGDNLQPPYYLTLQTGGSDEPVFSLTSSYIPAGSSTREILTGFLSVDSDAGSEAGVIGENYGTIRLQELPQSSNVPGPGQAQNNFDANAEVSRELNLLESGSTSVDRGNLLTLPLGGGLVYVEPVYVKSSGATSYPMLQKVLVAFGDQVGFADTLDEALDQVFGGDSGASAGDAENVGQTDDDDADDGSADTDVGTGDDADAGSGDDADVGTTGGTDADTTDDGSGDADAGTSGGSSSGTSDDLKAALDEASQALEDADAALQDGDWSAYGEAQDRLKEAINKAIELEE